MADEPRTEPESAPAPEAKTFTQEELDRVVGERLGREREKYADYDVLKHRLEEIETANQSELEKAQKKATTAEQRAATAESRLLRFEVAKDKEVPADAWDFLQGTSREELEASADKLLALVKSRTEPESEPDFDGGARAPAPDPKRPEDQHNDAVLALLGIESTN